MPEQIYEAAGIVFDKCAKEEDGGHEEEYKDGPGHNDDHYEKIN